MTQNDPSLDRYNCLFDPAMDKQTRNVLDTLLNETIKLRSEAPGISDDELHRTFQFAMNVSQQLASVVTDEIIAHTENPKVLPEGFKEMLLEQSYTNRIIGALVQILQTTPLSQMKDVSVALQEERGKNMPSRSLLDQVLDAPTSQTLNTPTHHEF